MNSVVRNLVALCAGIWILWGCDALDGYDAQIERATRDMLAAADDARRASAYAERGRGYSDKARLSLQRKLITPDEYRRLFDLAMQDHQQAIALDPGHADLYFKRGLSHYDRAAWAKEPDADQAPWFDAARTDFTAALARDPQHAMAYDYLGLVDEQTGRLEQAIVPYTQEMALNPSLGRLRLAELYCNRGRSLLERQQYQAAAADFERSIALAAPADGCSCEPYNPLAFLYVDAMQDDAKGWELMQRAQAAGVWIAPEYRDRLQQRSSANSPGGADR
jgi:tetratricopeptide (TPR) repeat protein